MNDVLIDVGYIPKNGKSMCHRFSARELVEADCKGAGKPELQSVSTQSIPTLTELGDAVTCKVNVEDGMVSTTVLTESRNYGVGVCMKKDTVETSILAGGADIASACEVTVPHGGCPRYSIRFSPDGIKVSKDLANEISFAYRVYSLAEDIYECLFKDPDIDPLYPITGYEEDDLEKAAENAGGKQELCRRIAEQADQEWDKEYPYWDNISNVTDFVIRSFLDVPCCD